MQDRLRALIERHCETLRDLVDAVGARLAPLASPGAAGAGHLGEVIELLHQLKGTSGTIGFLELSATARALETALKDLAASGEEVPATEMAGVLRQFHEMNRIATSIAPQDSTLFNADLSQLKAARRQPGNG